VAQAADLYAEAGVDMRGPVPILSASLAILLAVGGVAVIGAERPALIDAARNGDREAVRRLVKQGVNVRAEEGDGTTALHWASYRDDLESADLLIRAGAKV